MGAIWFCLYNEAHDRAISSDTFSGFPKLKHRGKDTSTFVIDTTPKIENVPPEHYLRFFKKSDLKRHGTRCTFMMGYHGMLLHDRTEDAFQPIELHEPGNQVTKLFCDGEIYNYKELQQTLSSQVSSKSDVEVILHMFHEKKSIPNVLNELSGDFSFIITKNTKSPHLKQIQAYAVRDVLGTKPLYHVTNDARSMHLFVSELKGIPRSMEQYTVTELPPGTYWSFAEDILNNNPTYIPYYSLFSLPVVPYTTDNTDLYTGINAVIRKCIVEKLGDVDLDCAVFLSGGLASSMMLSLIVDTLHRQGKLERGYSRRIKVFTMTYNDISEDVNKARQVVEFLNAKYGISLKHIVIKVDHTKHIERILSQVVYASETYEPQLVQKALLQYLICDHIKQKEKDIKVLFCGDFLSDIFGDTFVDGDIPDAVTLRHKKTMSNMHKLVTCLDKVTFAHNIELRLPFVHKEVVEFFLQMHPMHRKKLHFNIDLPKIDKYVLRKAFEMDEILPESVLWRESHGSRFAQDDFWIDMSSFFEKHCSDTLLDKYRNNKGANLTKEEVVYHELWKSLFPVMGLVQRT
jgi:asparagine synthase (glutamine-hydrolysing)